jgi:HK97 family phage portal protein
VNTATWYNAERVAIPGSVILNEWKAKREAERAAIQAATIHPSSSGTYGSELYEWLTGNAGSNAGPAVTERTAMAISAVYACVGLIGGALSSLPLPIYKRTEDSRERIEHPLWRLLNVEPTPVCSAAVWREYMMWALLLHGDAFARIHRKGGPRSRLPDVVRLEQLHPLAVTAFKNGDRLGYRVTDENEGQIDIDQDDMLHIPGLGFDGQRGMSPIRYAARQSMGMSLAADEYSARFFSNGARPDYVITTPGKMDAEQQKLFRESWMARYAGAQNAHIPAILTGGGEVKALSLNPEDAQLIETRSFQAADIARFYGVPPHMIGMTEKSTSWGSGIEQQGIGFVKYTLSRHLVKFEQEINRKLFRDGKQFAEFTTAGLERGDYKSRNEGYRIALGRAGEPAWMTVNEVRKLENAAPLPGGDDLPSYAPATPPAKDANAPAA